MNTAGYRPVFLGVAKGLLKLAVLLGGLWLIVRFFGQGLGAVAYQEMPVLGSRLSVWIAAQLHLLFAAFVLGVPIFAVIVEVVGVVTKDERYDRLAHEFTRLLALAFTITAVLGCLLFLGLYFLYPQFFKFMTGIFKPTYYFYVSLLAGEVVYAYLYYYSWNVLSGSTFNKLLHIVIGILLNLFGTLIMFTADAWASFMMSPAGVYETGHLMDLWKSINNFTWMPLNIHRLLANVAFGGFIAGAYAAIKYLMTEDPAQKAHYDWMGYTGNFIGALAMIPLPFAGYWLAREVYIYNQTMGVTMMGGIFSWLFIVQAVLIGVIFISINYYFWIGMSRVKGGERFANHQVWMLALIVICVAIWMTPHNLPMSNRELAQVGGPFHPLVGVLGVMSAKNTAVNLIILTTFISFLLYRRADKIEMVGWSKLGKVSQSLLLGAAAAIVIFYGIYGYFVPANVRVGFSVYQVTAVLIAMLAVTAIDIFLFRRAKSLGEVAWGTMPARSQYALITLAVTTVFLMGLMGYLRSGLRESWHIYGILRDSSLGAYTPKLGVACSIIGIITLIFFALVERTKKPETGGHE
jgi:cytochrome bd ubiquinol oxidase subunit I